MGIRIYRPYTPGTRERTVSDFAEITRDEPEKSLTKSRHRVTFPLRLQRSSMIPIVMLELRCCITEMVRSDIYCILPVLLLEQP